MYIPRFSRLLNILEQLPLRLDGYLIVQLKVKGVQVLNTTPNCISYKQLFSNTSFQRGLWNGTWTDMYIETTLMRYGHGPEGIVDIER